MNRTPQKTGSIKNRVSDKTELLLKFNYVSSVLSLVLGLFSKFILHILSPVPEVFFLYFVFNLANVAAFKAHKNLTVMAIVTSAVSFLSTIIISMYSGGINSPFIFILAIIVLAGYVSTSRFGEIYLYIIITVVFGIYFLGALKWNVFYNAVDQEAKDHFSLISLLFSIYLLGGIFGRDLLRAHHNLYKSKTEIEQRVHEKETLLREIHHRVKNNLQTISSLLNLQSKNSNDDTIKALIKSSQNRVITMAMIHEMLYMHDDLSKIDYSHYLKELCEFLIRTFKGNDHNIDLHIKVENIKLGIDTSIPLGLLINEVVTNALKYGIKGDEKGEINIRLVANGGQGYTLTISDNGMGFKGDLNAAETKSLGLKLINNLARQLRGSIVKDTAVKGTKYILDFQDIEKETLPIKEDLVSYED